MFNITVLRLKDIVKYIVCIFVLILLIVSITNYFTHMKKNAKEVTQKIDNATNQISNNSLLSCLDATLPVVASINNTESSNKHKLSESDLLKSILQTQIGAIKGTEDINEEIEQTNENNNTVENTDKQENGDVNLAKTDVKTEVITNNPIAESYNVQYGKVKIKNQTDYVLTEEMLTPNINIENKNIIIFHTHSCESYTSSALYPYTPTGNFRTTDLNFTVTRVGTELTNQLQQYGYNVIHDTSYHDYPSYNGSYTNSLKTVEGLLQSNPSDIIIDLHRDAIGSRSDYAPTVKIGDDEAAQIMFVIGTNAGGLWHPNWNENLKFAIKIQEKAEEMYPGLFKPLMLTTSRYNQHTGKYANIMEIGATGNTLEQCLNSMKYLAKVMDEVIK